MKAIEILARATRMVESHDGFPWRTSIRIGSGVPLQTVRAFAALTGGAVSASVHEMYDGTLRRVEVATARIGGMDVELQGSEVVTVATRPGDVGSCPRCREADGAGGLCAECEGAVKAMEADRG